MSSTTSKTVRMFDGTGYDTYKVGGKKHRAAEARRAAFDAERAAVKGLNGEIATFLRSKGINPKGRAWTEVKAGTTEAADLLLLTDKNLDRLRKLNRKDGIAAPAAGTTKAKKATVPTTEAEIEADVERLDREVATVSKRRSKAARKAYRTRVKNGTAVRVNGRFAKVAEPVEVAEEARSSKKALFWADLSDAGLSEAEIKAAWKVRQSA